MQTEEITKPRYSFESILAASERINWRVEDLIGGDKQLDFSRRFLPEGLACVEGMTMLNAYEKLVLNQIRGHAYLYMFGLVEEMIVPFVLDQVKPDLHGPSIKTRAYLEFVTEEAKHIDLFRRFRQSFLAGFGHHAAVIGPPEEVAKGVLAKHPLAVGLLILAIEWMTQEHWLAGARDDASLDPLIKDMLRHHWMEESQHAKLDELLVESMAARCTPEEMERVIDDFLAIGGMFDGALAQQVELDLAALEAATGRRLEGEDAKKARAIQHQANRWTFVGSGLIHPRFVAALERISPAARERIAAVAPAFASPVSSA